MIASQATVKEGEEIEFIPCFAKAKCASGAEVWGLEGKIEDKCVVEIENPLLVTADRVVASHRKLLAREQI